MNVPATNLELAEYIVGRIEGLGFDVHPLSRVARMRSIFDKGTIDDLKDEDFLFALEYLRDSYQLKLIVDTMDGHKNAPIISIWQGQMHSWTIGVRNDKLFKDYGLRTHQWVKGKRTLAILVFDFAILWKCEPEGPRLLASIRAARPSRHGTCHRTVVTNWKNIENQERRDRWKNVGVTRVSAGIPLYFGLPTVPNSIQLRNRRGKST